jgi:hypothetical protein
MRAACGTAEAVLFVLQSSAHEAALHVVGRVQRVHSNLLGADTRPRESS